MSSWSYGLTTVPERRTTTLPRTLASLKNAGFDKPRLFVDGAPALEGYGRPEWETTVRWPRIRPMGNWLLALWELFIREPSADRYAIFQDDVLFCANLRAYLERSPYPDKGYLNLYSTPSNESLPTFKGFGWVRARDLNSGPFEPVCFQTGRGALALVFSHEAVTVLLSSPHFVKKLQDPHRGWRSIDGAVVTAMNQRGYSEYVHCPSLCQHIGDVSTVGNLPLADRHASASWRGESYDPTAAR